MLGGEGRERTGVRGEARGGSGTRRNWMGSDEGSERRRSDGAARGLNVVRGRGVTGRGAQVGKNDYLWDMKRIEVVAAVIRKGDRIFATQRGYGDFKDRWEFPGGKVEAGETPQEALEREIREELCAEINIESYIDTVEWDYPAFHLTMHCFMCSLRSEALHLNEHEAAQWISKEEAGSLDWLPADRDLLPEILAELI